MTFSSLFIICMLKDKNLAKNLINFEENMRKVWIFFSSTELVELTFFKLWVAPIPKNYLNNKREKKKEKKWHMLSVTCHLSCVTNGNSHIHGPSSTMHSRLVCQDKISLSLGTKKNLNPNNLFKPYR